jgi:hypothetical protein
METFAGIWFSRDFPHVNTEPSWQKEHRTSCQDRTTLTEEAQACMSRQNHLDRRSIGLHLKTEPSWQKKHRPACQDRTILTREDGTILTEEAQACMSRQNHLDRRIIGLHVKTEQSWQKEHRTSSQDRTILTEEAQACLSRQNHLDTWRQNHLDTWRRSHLDGRTIGLHVENNWELSAKGQCFLP